MGEKDFPLLNADIWTGWSDNNMKDCRNNIKATKFLLSQVVTHVCHIVSSKGASIRDSRNVHDPIFSISKLHYLGVNVRHLGVIKCNLSDKNNQNIILIHVLSRTLKNVIRLNVRNAGKRGVFLSSVKESITIILNSMTTIDHKNKSYLDFWYKYLTMLIVLFGTKSLTDIEKSHIEETTFLRKVSKSNIPKRIIFQAVSMSALVFRRHKTNKQRYNVGNRALQNFTQFYGFVFTQADIEISNRVKDFKTVEMARCHFMRSLLSISAKKLLLNLLDFPNNNVAREASSRMFAIATKYNEDLISMTFKEYKIEELLFQKLFCKLMEHDVLENYKETPQIILKNKYINKNKLSSIEKMLSWRLRWLCSIDELYKLNLIRDHMKTNNIFQYILLLNDNVIFRIPPEFRFYFGNLDSQDIFLLKDMNFKLHLSKLNISLVTISCMGFNEFSKYLSTNCFIEYLVTPAKASIYWKRNIYL